VLAGGEIPDLVEYVDVNSLHVYAPTSILFVCGGKIDLTTAPPSLRDAFLREWHDTGDTTHSVLLAEELNAFFPEGHYRDILTFESDIAQISELIILFSESVGSFAELGAFCVEDEIARHLLVVMDDFNYAQRSFVTLGPIRILMNKYGDSSVCVLDRRDIKIKDIINILGVDSKSLLRLVHYAISERTRGKVEHTTFDPTRSGHIVKLIVGLIQHYGALTLAEIDVFLYHLNVTITAERIEDLLLCAEFAKWIVKSKRGLYTYYSSIAERTAFRYRISANVKNLDRARVQADIARYWQSNEPERFSCIQEARRISP
jgi:hypothetical protein